MKINPIMRFEQVSYIYEESKGCALQDVSLMIPAQMRTALIGHNGSGKSTLFLHGTGIYKPTHGQLFYKEEPYRYDRKCLRELRQKVGLVMQDPEHQLLAATVAEDLSYGLCNKGLTDDMTRKVVAEIAEQFGLTSLLDKPLHQLSLGQKKLVTLAGVMALKPEVLLLDEPTAYLDRYHVDILLDQLEAIWQQGTSIMLATHDLDLAYGWADWIIVMHQGRVVLQGSPDEVFQQKELLHQMKLGVPLIYEVWEIVQNAQETSKRGNDGDERTVVKRGYEEPPRSIEAFQNKLAR
ncbi:energy-coupling factor ABC transporter ATP-binding protein [Brevibacillus daliensis]|uniref:energy-coupling factor ABC transporter ATP-binding protein n=1 Tax=Brevibacillus daliensis TaxID=2892995 RepID=UPI001E50E5C2|nr:ABC transporter ATP-binding protein [Brevibacillus daliensis]